MAVLNYELHEKLADHHAMLSALKDFAVAQGWTNVFFNQNATWAHQGGGVYAFDPGAESFLILHSTGYGSQDLQYRFHGGALGTIATHEWLSMYGYVGSSAIDFNSGVHPVSQTTIGTRDSRDLINSVPSQEIPKTWFFGNDKFIAVVLEVDPIFCKVFAFGSVELYDPAEVDGNLYLHQAFSSPTVSTYYWFNHNAAPVFDSAGSEMLRWNGDRFNSFVDWVHTTTNNHTNGIYGSYGAAVTNNINYAGRRPIFKQKYYALDTGDSRIVPIGKAWWGRIDTQDFEIGQRVKYGSEEWLTFPYGRVNERFKGFCFQVAA